MAHPAKQKASPVLPSDKAAALALTPVSRETEARMPNSIPAAVIARSASDEAIHTFFAATWIASLRSQ
jgi:hypothetical protein